MERLKLDIQRFASGGGEYTIEFFTARGDYGQGYWDDLGWGLFKLHSVPTIDDYNLNYYGYTSMVEPHFMGWTISGVNYTVEELKTKEFNFYSVEPPYEAWAWVVDMNNYKEGATIGSNKFSNITLNGYTIKGIYYNGSTVWSGGVHDSAHIWIEYHNPWIDPETGGEKKFAVYLIGDFCNWDTGNAILMQGEYGMRRVDLPISMGETMDCKFYIPEWGNDAWQTSTYPTTDPNGYIHIEYDISNYIFVYGGNSYEVKGSVDTIISDEDYNEGK